MPVPLFNKLVSHPTMKIRRIIIFKTGFRKLLLLSKFCKIMYMAGGRRSSCLHHNDTLHTKIDMWLSRKVKLLKVTIDYKITVTNHINTLCSNILSALTRINFKNKENICQKTVYCNLQITSSYMNVLW